MRAPDVQTRPGGVANAEQPKTDINTVGDADAQRKRLANISANLCREGFALLLLSCGGYLITRWDKSTYAPDLRTAEKFYELVSGRRV